MSEVEPKKVPEPGHNGSMFSPKHNTSLLWLSEPNRLDRSTRTSTCQSPSKCTPRPSSQRRFLSANSFLSGVGIVANELKSVKAQSQLWHTMIVSFLTNQAHLSSRSPGSGKVMSSTPRVADPQLLRMLPRFVHPKA